MELTGNLDNTKTKYIDNSKDVDKIANSISKTIINSNYASVKELATVIKTHLEIFFNDSHMTKLGQKIFHLENNMKDLKAKSKAHNITMNVSSDFWRDKYKEKVTEEEINLCFDELNTMLNTR